MKRINIIKNIIFLQLIYVMLPAITQAQVAGLNSVFPLQNALHIPADVNIGVQFNSPMDRSTLNESTFIVMGEQSGMHFGTVLISSDSMSAEFIPDKPFFTGELVTVTLTIGISDSSGTAFGGFIWNFLVAVTNRTNARFAEPDTVLLGDVVKSAIMGDYNGDGFVDIAIHGAANQVFVIMLNDGFGNFNLHELIAISDDPLEQIAMLGNGDMDNDGDIDFVTSHLGSGEKILFTTLLWNDGNGFIEDTTVIHDFHNRGQLMDVNADGNLDMIGAGDDGETLTAILNSGKGQFTDTIMSDFKHKGSGHYILDSDNDGDVDIVMSRDNMRLILGINAGDGKFIEELADSAYGNCSSPNCIIALDFNDDGLVDIAEVSAQNNLLIYTNLNSTFILTSSIELEGNRKGKLLGKDIDGDGDVDLITSGRRGVGAMPPKSETNVQIWLNDGDGNFTLVQTYLWVDFFPRGNTISLADIENDGDLDLLIFSDWEMWILRNETIISVEDEIDVSIPTEYSLSQNYPNPFNPITTIEYSLPEPSNVRLIIYNLSGQEVARLVDGEEAAGNYTIEWDASKFASGLYFYRLSSGKFVQTKKMMLLK